MIRKLIAISCLAALAGCASQDIPKERYSGFLSERYYEKLAKVESPSDQVVFRFISPNFKADNYHHIQVDPVIAYPKPQATENVSMDVLITLQAKLTRLIEDSISEALPLSQTSGPGVLRAQAAITGVDVSNTGLKAYEYIPIAMIAAGANTAAGGRDQAVRLFLESRMVDSVSGEVMMVGIREIRGEDLENVKTKLEAQQLNQGLTTAGKDIVAAMKKLFNK